MQRSKETGAVAALQLEIAIEKEGFHHRKANTHLNLLLNPQHYKVRSNQDSRHFRQQSWKRWKT